MANWDKRKLDLQSLDAKVKEMERLGLIDQGQKDWDDDARDPMEQSMVTKDRPFNNQPFMMPRGGGGQGSHKRGRNKGRWNNNPQRGRGNNNSQRGRGNNNSQRGRGSGGSYYGGRVGNRSFESMSMSGSDVSSSAHSAMSYGRFSSQRSVESEFDDRSDDRSTFSSVSQRRPSSAEKLTASCLAQRLAEFDSFQATLLQLLDRFDINHKEAERVARENSSTFEVESELVRLRPQSSICSHYLDEGCIDRENCKNIHLCSKYIFGQCSNKNCFFGHFWMTDHNKRVFQYFKINTMNAKQLHTLFKNYVLPKAKSADLKVCDKYNEDTCDDNECQKLHLCLMYLSRQCTGDDCKLSHDISEGNTSSVLQMHGVSLNESPRDILLNIVNFPAVKATIEALKSQESASDETESSESTQTKTKKSDIASDVKIDDKDAKVEEDVPLKTMWSYDLIGNVTLDEICYNSVEDYCSFEESGCWRLHCPSHFHWQIKATLGKKVSWVNLTEGQAIALEKAFCDPSISKVNLPVLDPLQFKSSEKGLLLILKGKSKWEANFDTMDLILTGKNDILELRRLCTEDIQSETPLPCIWKWFFSDKNQNWIEYGNVDSTGEEKLKCDISSKDIEANFHTRSKSPISFKNQSFSYLLDLQSMTQTNLQTNVVRKVRRRPTPHLKDKTPKSKSDLPSNWESMTPEERSKRVTISPSSDEYKTLNSYVQTQAQGNSYNILKIERVQNPYLWKAFQNKVQEMKVTYKNDATIDIRQLFHGTGPDIVPKICEENFDWRLHGTSAGQAYGRGTYFSTLSSYSYGYAKADSNGHRYMFVAKVAVGTTTTGNSGMARPPINQQYNLPYDATVDNMANPTIIVKYDKQEYFPEYIITFG